MKIFSFSVLFVISVFVIIYYIINVNIEWIMFKKKYSKTYRNLVEEKFRYMIFRKNLQYIRLNNNFYFQNLISFKMEANEFTDLLSDEVNSILNKLQVPQSKNTTSIPIISHNLSLPNYINWTEHGAVTSVKNQGFCGSCWAFAATGALEGQQYLKSKKLISLSEQNLIDCSGDYGNNGCHGGYMTYAYEYVENNDGIDTEKSYPYDEEDFLYCRYMAKNKGATAKGYINLPADDEIQLMKAVATIGPISVGIDASLSSFRFYKDGIYYEPNCCKNECINHAVLVVGYGTDNETGNDYWIVKNSWGKRWGNLGYILMARNKKNNCCIASVGSYPLM